MPDTLSDTLPDTLSYTLSDKMPDTLSTTFLFLICQLDLTECDINCARSHSHDSTSELYSCIKGKCPTKLFSQFTNAAEVI
ncbi:hypothetical protein EB796_005941 [Bugula neritina]|uniref:Uncharacterized protein n=1 Tax=Bugula neritina TaxID=10212 RepID=A0A7J7KAS2_BUGNE|nr:hypothetical protein EB796_005941 [Bugula neritina]